MKPLVKYILRWADDALIMSHRLSQYCSQGPFLEEDLAISNVALDYIGQSEALLTYCAQLDNTIKDANALAYLRPEHLFFNCQLVEQPNKDYAYLMMRQFLYDCYNYETYIDLVNSKDAQLAAIATKALKEITYHLKRSSEWIIRLGQGTAESHQRIQIALDDLWKYTGALFIMDDLDKTMEKDHIGIDLTKAKNRWDERITDILAKANLKKPQTDFFVSGGRDGHHTEHMGHLLAEMQYLPRAYPDATWA